MLLIGYITDNHRAIGSAFPRKRHVTIVFVAWRLSLLFSVVDKLHLYLLSTILNLYASIAQLAEYSTLNRRVPNSILGGST